MIYLYTATGRVLRRRNPVVSFISVFWYPNPAPRWIEPRSLSGPHEAVSGRKSGIWLNRITGSPPEPTIVYQKISYQIHSKSEWINFTGCEIFYELCSAMFWCIPCFESMPGSDALVIFVNESRSIYKHQSVVSQRQALIQWSEMGEVALLWMRRKGSLAT